MARIHTTSGIAKMITNKHPAETAPMPVASCWSMAVTMEYRKPENQAKADAHQAVQQADVRLELPHQRPVADA